MHGAASEIASPSDREPRRYERTHLFLAATLCAKAGSCPVHIRNISACGALIEGSITPDLGEPLVLRRGRLDAAATIVWKAGRKAGISFSAIVHAADWMAQQPGSHQGRVDDIIQEVRSGTGSRPGMSSESTEIPFGHSVEAELRTLKTTLAELEKGLIEDVILVSTHPEIQLLDLARQAVDRMLNATRTG